jgi:hypothetical protein
MAAIDFPNTPSLNQEFTVGSKTWVWDGISWNAKQNGLFKYNIPASQGFLYYDDMLYLQGTDGSILTTAKTGASSITSIANPDYNSFGVLQLNPGATASTSRITLYAAQPSSIILANNGTSIYETRIMQTILSTSSLRYVSIFGFTNLSTTISTQTIGVFFIYDEGGTFTGTASPNWQVCIQNGTSNTFVTTSAIVTANTWNRLKIQTTSTATPPTSTSATFYIDDYIVATPTVTNFPTGALGFSIGTFRGIGTGSTININVDYLSVSQQFITGR